MFSSESTELIVRVILQYDIIKVLLCTVLVKKSIHIFDELLNELGM